MKKKYTKPMVSVEFYKLSQSIASCTIKIGYNDNMCVQSDADTPDHMYSIAVTLPDVFTAQGCLDDYANYESGNDYICYHTQANATFTS